MPSLRRVIKRLKDPRDLLLFLKILLMLIRLPRQIRRFSLPSLLLKIDPGVYRARPSESKLLKTVGFVDSLLRYRIFQRYGKCLLRSLILFRFLRLQGWPVEIHFGVRKDSKDTDKITGHSWLVLDGQPFLENDDQQGAFSTTYSYSG